MATLKTFKTKIEKLGYEIPTDATRMQAERIQRLLGEIREICNQKVGNL